MDNAYLLLYSHNIIVTGKEYDALYDLQNQQVYPVPRILTTIINDLKELPVAQVRQKYAPNEPALFNKYLDFIIRKDLGFYTVEPGRFPAMELAWKTPCKIQSAVLEYDGSSYSIKDALNQLDELLCHHVELRFVSPGLSLQHIEEVLRFCTSKAFRSLHIFSYWDSTFSETSISAVFQRHAKVHDWVNYACPFEKKEDAPPYKIRYTKTNIEETLFRSEFSQQKHIADIYFVTESMSWNTYFNKRVCINRDGHIKNSLCSMESYGHVEDNRLSNITETDAFRLLWSLGPDKMEAWKESSLRYCTYITGLPKEASIEVPVT